MVVKRNPDRTRETILEAAFHEIHQNGFRAASIDHILASTGLTKGALYHHFPNKAALGYAVVDEIIGGYVHEMWLRPLDGQDDPIGSLISQLSSMSAERIEQSCTLGCPLNNLAQEMSPVDDTFRKKIEAVFDAWRSGIAGHLERGQKAGRVRAEVDCEQVATFFVASVEGAGGLAKNARDPQVLATCIESLTHYLEGLRPPPANPAAS